MIDAVAALQLLAIERLRASDPLTEQLTGIYDGPPPRAAYPYLEITGGSAIDWSHKTGIGREVQLSLTVRDDGRSSSRLQALIGTVDGALEGLSGTTDGWRIATFRFQRSRIVRAPDGPWSGLIDYRARLEKV